MRRQVGAERIVHRAGRRLGGFQRSIDGSELVGKIETDPAVARTDRAAADPHDITGRAQLIELGWAIAAKAGRQELAFQCRRNQCRTLQLRKRFDQIIETAAFSGDAVPRLDEAGIRLWLDRLDLSAQHGQ